MFDIGFGEILLIMLIVFLICPKDIPKIFRKLGQFFAGIEKFKNEIFDIKKDLTDSFSDLKKETSIDTEETLDKIIKKKKRTNSIKKKIASKK